MDVYLKLYYRKVPKTARTTARNRKDGSKYLREIKDTSEKCLNL